MVYVILMHFLMCVMSKQNLRFFYFLRSDTEPFMVTNKVIGFLYFDLGSNGCDRVVRRPN